MKKIIMSLPALMALAAPMGSFAQDNQDLIAKGEYLARAGDCTACHTAPGQKPFAGGYAFSMPMGTIISSNITPSKQFGIGDWTEQQFARAVREGVRPDGSVLYPAMPYTAYGNITDDDMKALYAYFQSIPAVDAAPVQKTTLDFPFNLPGLMWVWKTLFASSAAFTPNPTLTAEENRGKYLVEGLTHCSTCHTPRNQFMAEDMTRYLSGAHVDGWLAPNITADKNDGIGGWSNQELVSYLRNGHAEGKAQAGGPMADAIEHSFRYLTQDDINAIVAYLRTVPPVGNQSDAQPSWGATQSKPVAWDSFETGGSKNNQPGYRDSTTTDGALLYSNNCAACHGINGEGSDDHYFPSLTHNTAVGAKDPSNLVMAIVDGIHRKGADGEAVMPAFGEKDQMIHSWLSTAQIAAVTNYVTEHFGYGNAGLTASDVEAIERGTGDVPFMIRYAKAFFAAGVAVAAIVLIVIVVLVRRRKRQK